MFFAKGTATFINGLANLLNKDPKNPSDWIILQIWAFESFQSVGILLWKAFLSFVFFSLVANNNSCGKLFPLNIFKLILKVVPVLFLTLIARECNKQKYIQLLYQ